MCTGRSPLRARLEPGRILPVPAQQPGPPRAERLLAGRVQRGPGRRHCAARQRGRQLVQRAPETHLARERAAQLAQRRRHGRDCLRIARYNSQAGLHHGLPRRVRCAPYPTLPYPVQAASLLHYAATSRASSSSTPPKHTSLAGARRSSRSVAAAAAHASAEHALSSPHAST